MRIFFILLTVGLIVIGFINPFAWIGAVIAGVLAMLSAPSGTRADGKRRTGGLLGGVVDNIVIASKMQECPNCKAKIMKDASKCRNYGEWVVGQGRRVQREDGKELIRIKGFMNLSMIDFTTAQDSKTKDIYRGKITYNKNTDEWLIETNGDKDQ